MLKELYINEQKPEATIKWVPYYGNYITKIDNYSFIPK